MTTPNPETHKDMQLFKRLGLKPEQRIEKSDDEQEALLTKAMDAQANDHLFYEAASKNNESGLINTQTVN